MNSKKSIMQQICFGCRYFYELFCDLDCFFFVVILLMIFAGPLLVEMCRYEDIYIYMCV